MYSFPYWVDKNILNLSLAFSFTLALVSMWTPVYSGEECMELYLHVPIFIMLLSTWATFYYQQQDIVFPDTQNCQFTHSIMGAFECDL
jgi:hypothetical protein